MRADRGLPFNALFDVPTFAAMQDSDAISAARTIELLLASPRSGERRDYPYDHWLLRHCLPDEVIVAVTRLPIAPAAIEDTQGRRETHNDSRIHFGPAYRSRHPVMDVLAQVFQSPMVTTSLPTITGAALSGTSLRIEYCQDSDGFWLEPHTDIYAGHDTHVGRAPRRPATAG